jgi:hypothetical protein
MGLSGKAVGSSEADQHVMVRAEAPDLTLQAGPRVIASNPIDVTFVAGFSIPLPL